MFVLLFPLSFAHILLKLPTTIVLFPPHPTPALTLLFDCHKNPSTRTLEGISPTREYLKMLGNANIDIIFRFSVWVLEENAEGGLKVRLFVMYSGTCL